MSFDAYALISMVFLISRVSGRATFDSFSDKFPKIYRQGRAIPDSPSGYAKIPVSDDFKMVYRIYEECRAKDALLPCLKMKFITAIDRLSKKAELPIIAGITLVKDNNKDTINCSESSDTHDNYEALLPRSIDEKNIRLDEIIWDRISKFLSGRNVQFKLSEFSRMSDDATENEIEDGRGKKNRYGGLMMLPLMMGGSMIPMALMTLALLAGKALIIAKLALVLSLIIGLKKLISNDEQGSYQVVNHGAGHYKRSFQEDEFAHSAAYKSYLPSQSSTPHYRN